jgi:hypothetical protein
MSSVARNGRGKKIFAYQRLEELVQLLTSGADIPTAARLEIALALDLLFIEQLEDEPRRPGRRPSPTWTQAAIALRLMERFGIPRKEAVAATLKTGTTKEFDRVSRAFDKLSSGEENAPKGADIIVHDLPAFAEAVNRILADRNK